MSKTSIFSLRGAPSEVSAIVAPFGNLQRPLHCCMDSTVSWSILPREWSVQVRHRSGPADAQSLFSTDSVQPALGQLIEGATNL